MEEPMTFNEFIDALRKVKRARVSYRHGGNEDDDEVYVEAVVTPLPPRPIIGDSILCVVHEWVSGRNPLATDLIIFNSADGKYGIRILEILE